MTAGTAGDDTVADDTNDNETAADADTAGDDETAAGDTVAAIGVAADNDADNAAVVVAAITLGRRR